MAERLTTRSKNPGTHPGLCDAPKPRRSSAEVAADKKANDAKIKELKEKHAATLQQVAQIEAENQQLEKNANLPSVPTSLPL